MDLYFLIIIILFPFIWFLITLIMVQKIWNKLSNFKIKDNFEGKSIGKIHTKLEFTNLRTKMECKVGKNGLFLNPIILGKKLFNPVYIPWKNIKTKKDSYLGVSFIEVTITNSVKTRLCLRKKDFLKIKNAV